MATFQEKVQIASSGELQLMDSDNSQKTGFKAPSNVTSDSVYEMPAAYPASIAFLKSSNAGVLTWDTNTYISGTLANLTEANSAVLIITGGTNAVVGSGTTIEVKAASASQGGYVSTGSQTFAGAKTFNGNIIKANDTTNASLVSGLVAGSAGASAADGESMVITFAENVMMFHIEINSASFAGESMLCVSSKVSAGVSAPSDLGGLFLLSDAGVGLYISKSAASNDITIKSRLGEAATIRVRLIECSGTATAWA